MKKEIYVLSAYGQVKAVILAATELELGKKTALAIQEEESAEEGTTTVNLGCIGDWGEDTNIVAVYVNNGEQVTNTDYTLRKTVSY